MLCRLIVGAHGFIELHRRLGNEVEDGRGVHRRSQRLVGSGIDFCGGQAAQIREAITHLHEDGGHGFDVAHTVLEAHEVGATVGQNGQRFRCELGAVAVVDDDAEVHALAHLFHMRDQTFLTCFCQVMRQKQHTMGTQSFGFLRMSDGRAGGSACTGNDGNLAAAGVDGGLDDLAVFLTVKREVLACAACREQRRCAVGGQPFKACRIALGIEVAIGIKVRHRKGQQA